MTMGRNLALTTATLSLLLTGTVAKLKGEGEIQQQQQQESQPHEFEKVLDRALGYEECCEWKCKPLPPPPPPPPGKMFKHMGSMAGHKKMGHKEKHVGKKDKHYGYDRRALAQEPNHQRQLQGGGYYPQYGGYGYPYSYTPYVPPPDCYWDCSGCGKCRDGLYKLPLTRTFFFAHNDSF